MKTMIRILSAFFCLLFIWACSTQSKRSVETGERKSYHLKMQDGQDVSTLVTETCVGSDDLDFPEIHRGQCYKKTCQKLAVKNKDSKKEDCTFEGNLDLLEVYNKIEEVRDQQRAENRKILLEKYRGNCFQNGIDSCLEWINGDYFSGLDVIGEICKNKKFKCETTFLEADTYGRNRECVHGQNLLTCEHSRNGSRYSTKLSPR